MKHLTEKQFDNFFKTYNQLTELAKVRAIGLMSLQRNDFNLTPDEIDGFDPNTEFEVHADGVTVDFELYRGGDYYERDSQSVDKKFLMMYEEAWSVFMAGAQANYKLMQEQEAQRLKDQVKAQKQAEIDRLQKELREMEGYA